MNIDSVSFFQGLAHEMNASAERLRVIGDADMTVAIVMRRSAGDFAVRLRFDGLCCDEVVAIDPGQAAEADFWLDGDLDRWMAMFDDIIVHGSASGRMTINSLALVGSDIRLRGADPMGVDKFSRFNQTLQEYLDGAGRAAVAG